MREPDDLAKVVLEALRRRFPSDLFYAYIFSERGTAIYVNHICYMSTYSDSNVLFMSKMGVTDSIDWTHEFNAADPEFFNKVIDLVMYNLIYYERYQDGLIARS